MEARARVRPTNPSRPAPGAPADHSPVDGPADAKVAPVVELRGGDLSRVSLQPVHARARPRVPDPRVVVERPRDHQVALYFVFSTARSRVSTFFRTFPSLCVSLYFSPSPAHLGVKVQRHDLRAVAVQRAPLRAVFHVPQLGGVLHRARGDQVALGGEAHAHDLRLVACGGRVGREEGEAAGKRASASARCHER